MDLTISNHNYNLKDVHVLMNLIHFYKRETVLAKYSDNNYMIAERLDLHQLVCNLQQEFEIVKAEYEAVKRETSK